MQVDDRRFEVTDARLRLVENPRDRVAGFRVLQLLPGMGPANAARCWERVVESGKAIDIVTSEGLFRIESRDDLHAFCAEALPDAYASFLRESG